MEKFGCPFCSKTNFSKAGLVGHLYHIHGVGGSSRAVAETVTRPNISELTARVFELTEQLRNLRQKRTEAEALENRSWGGLGSDETVEQLCKAYDAAERTIRRELARLDVEAEAAA